MKIPVIKIRSIYEGKAHDRLVGTNSHDCLFVEHGGIYYLNIQGMVSTQYPEKDGPFIVTKPFKDIDETFSGSPEIEFVSVEEYLEIIKAALEEEYKDEVALQALIQETADTMQANKEHEERMERLMQSPHYFWHT